MRTSGVGFGAKVFIAAAFYVATVPCLLFAESDSDAEPDRYLFDCASQVYQVFAEARAPQGVRLPSRSLASMSPLIRDHEASASGESLADKIQAAIRSGVVSPGDIQLPNDSSHDTQDNSKSR